MTRRRPYTALLLGLLYCLGSIPVNALILGYRAKGDAVVSCSCGCEAGSGMEMSCCCGPAAHASSDGSFLPVLDCDSQNQQVRPVPLEPHLRGLALELTAIHEETAPYPEQPRVRPLWRSRLPEKIPIV